mgnify:CR=1 FL=1
MPTKNVELTGFYFVSGDGKLSQNYADVIKSVDIYDTETDAEPIYPIDLRLSNETASVEISGVSTVNLYTFCKYAFGWSFIDYLYYKIFGKLAPWRKGVF